MGNPRAGNEKLHNIWHRWPVTRSVTCAVMARPPSISHTPAHTHTVSPTAELLQGVGIGGRGEFRRVVGMDGWGWVKWVERRSGGSCWFTPPTCFSSDSKTEKNILCQGIRFEHELVRNVYWTKIRYYNRRQLFHFSFKLCISTCWFNAHLTTVYLSTNHLDTIQKITIRTETEKVCERKTAFNSFHLHFQNIL